MGMVHALQQGKLHSGDVSQAVRDAAKSISPKAARDFAKTKRSKLPTRKHKKSKK